MNPGPTHPGHQSALTEILATPPGVPAERPDGPQTSRSAGPEVPGTPGHGSRHRWLLVVGGGLVLMLLVRAFVLASYYIPSTSMEPTLEPGDRIVVTKLGAASTPQRGDLVVFDGTHTFADRSGESESGQLSGLDRALDAMGSVFGANESDYVKRVIGLPGDHVVCCEGSGLLVVNDVPVTESYIFAGDQPSELTFDVMVPAGRIWVMGDHRSDSADSRAHLGDPGGGMVRLDDVIGRAAMVYWPPSRVGVLSTPEPLAGKPGNNTDGDHT